MEPRSQDLWVQKSRVFYKLWGRYMLWFILISVEPVVAPTHLSLFVATVIIVTLYFIFFFCVFSFSHASIFPPFTPLFEGIKNTLCNCFGKKNNIFFILDCSFLFFCYKPFKHLWMIIVVVESISKWIVAALYIINMHRVIK